MTEVIDNREETDLLKITGKKKKKAEMYNNEMGKTSVYVATMFVYILYVCGEYLCCVHHHHFECSHCLFHINHVRRHDVCVSILIA